MRSSTSLFTVNSSRCAGSIATPATNPMPVWGPMICWTGVAGSVEVGLPASRWYSNRLLRFVSLIMTRSLSGSTTTPLKLG